MQINVGIGEYAITNNENASIKTFALASCIGVTAYSPLRRVGGMLHIALPYPFSEDEGKSKPAYYASTGVPLFINELCTEAGCSKGELKIGIFGGADSVNSRDVFNIGKRNIEAVIEALELLGLKYIKADIGGTVSRTIEMDISTGSVLLLTQPINI